MRRRILSWLLAIAVTTATLMPSSTAIAAEELTDYAQSSALESTEAPEQILDEELALDEDVPEDGAVEDESDQYEELIEGTEEGAEEGATDEELLDIPTDEATVADSKSEEEELELATDEDGATADIEEDSSLSEEGLKADTPNGMVDPDIEENLIGFVYSEDVDDSTQIIGPGITIHSTMYGKDVKVEIYASEKADRSNAKLIATKKGISNPLDYYYGYDDAKRMREYEQANYIPVDFIAIGGGKWYIFAKFYAGDKEFAETANNILLRNTYTAPVLTNVVDATASNKADGFAVFKGDDHEKLYYSKVGSGSVTGVGMDKDGDYVTGKLTPGTYAAYFEGSRHFWFSKVFDVDSEATVFTVGVKEPAITGLTLSRYNYDETLPEGVVIVVSKGQSIRIVGSVTPATAPDTGVVYSSSNPKAVSVDALGNIKGLTAGGSATITVSTHAVGTDGKPLFTKSYDVSVDDTFKVNVKSAKLDKTAVTLEYISKATPTPFELSLTYETNEPCLVDWSIDNTGVVKPYEIGEKATSDKKTNTKKFYAVGPGKAVITADIGGVKKVTCTVTVNGEDELSGAIFSNGKYLTGFWAFDEKTNKPVASGNAALNKENVEIKYFDPASYKPLDAGTYIIEKKLYVFDKDGLLIRGSSNKDGKANPNCITNKLGELQTGWQKPDGDTYEHYFSPVNGLLVTSNWVPKGKGITFVDESGRMIDSNGIDLSVDGIHECVVQYKRFSYCFKGGIRQSGIIYFDAAGVPTTVKKASFAAYFDAASGIMHTGGFYGVNGNTYYTNSDGKIELGKRFVSATGATYYADGNGAIVTGPKIATDTNNVAFYVDEEGRILFNDYFVFDGRVYYAGSNGTVLETNDEASVAFYYINADKSRAPAYLKLANPKKVTAGTFFYSDPECKKKLTNEWLYQGKETDALVYVDKSGKLASGVCKIADGTTWFFNPDDSNKRGIDKTGYVVTYNKNLYLCDSEGKVYTDTTRFIEEDDNYYRVKNAAGVLLTGVQTIDGKRYLFDKKGYLCEPYGYGDYPVIEDYDNEHYFLGNPDYDGSDPATWYIYAPGKTIVMYTGHSEKMAVSKDGTCIRTGWVTVDGNKYYALEYGLANSRYIFKVGGKYYTFNDDGTLHTGWSKKTTRFTVFDITDLSTMREYKGEYYFYSNPKSGVIETGWKSMNALRTDGVGNINDPIGLTGLGDKKKMYFNPTGTIDLPFGALVRNADYPVDGKVYRFGADGGVVSGDAAFVETSPSSETPEGIDWYRNADGTLAKGRTLVKTDSGSYYFYFSQIDGKKEVNVFRKTGNKWYYYGANGVMATSATIYRFNGGGKAIANFNADGSVKNFEAVGGSGEILKNEALLATSSTSYSVYVLGSDGLPLTGMVAVPGLNRSLYVEADGAIDGGLSDYSNMALRKVGSKYYMFVDGMLLNKDIAKDADGSDLFQYDKNTDTISVKVKPSAFEYMSAADKADVERYMRYLYYFSGEEYLHVALNADGSIRSGEIKTEKGTYHANKLGIVLDYLSVFINSGGWKYSAMISEGQAGSNTGKLANINTNGEVIDVIQATIFWDANGNLLPIVNAKTGKPLTGIYVSDAMLINLKDGKLVTGKVTIKEYGYPFVVDIDKELGYAIYIGGK